MLIEQGEKDAVEEAVPTGERGRGVLERLPDLLGAALVGFSVPAMLLLLFGFFAIPVVLVLGVVGAAVAVVLTIRGDDEPHVPHARMWTLGAIVVALAFFVVNAKWSAQNIYATRDPATYSLAGQWLVHHHEVLIPTDHDVFGNTQGLTPDSPGFRTDFLHSQDVYAQGNHLLPALLGVTGWIGGTGALFRTNALIGALALLALFGLTRRFAGGGFALAAITALAVSMPMHAFSRDTYTEPVTLLLLFGGLSLLWRAIETRRWTQFLVAGATLGGASMARIDGYAALFAVPVVGTVLLCMARPGERRAWFGRVAALVVGTVFTAGIGFLDVTRLSSGYYHDLRGSVLALIEAGAGLAVVGAVIVLIAWTTPLLDRMFAVRPRRWLSYVAGGAVVLLFAGLTSRPLWMTSHIAYSGGIAALQRGLRLPIDGTRSYDEHTVSWISWYYGWPLVVAAFLGLALLAYHVVRHADVRLLGVASMVLALSALYFVKASINPDQIWAMRRYLPVVIPGMLAAAAFLLFRFAQRGRLFRYVAVALALLFVAVPAYIAKPMVKVRTGVPQVAEVRAICGALPGDAAVVSLGTSGIGSYTQTMRSFCNVPSAAMPAPTAQRLAQAQATARTKGRELYVISEAARFVPYAPDITNPQPFYVAHVTKWPERLVDVPGGPNRYDVPVFLGVVRPDGTVTAVLPGQTR